MDPVDGVCSRKAAANGSINCKALHTAAAAAAAGEAAAAASVRMEVRVNASLWTDVIA